MENQRFAESRSENQRIKDKLEWIRGRFNFELPIVKLYDNVGVDRNKSK